MVASTESCRCRVEVCMSSSISEHMVEYAMLTSTDVLCGEIARVQSIPSGYQPNEYLSLYIS